MSRRDLIDSRREAGRDSAERFIRGPLARRMGWDPKAIEIYLPPGGKRSVLFFARPRGGGSGGDESGGDGVEVDVVDTNARPDPVIVRPIGDAAEFSRHWRGVAASTEQGGSTPRLIYRSRGPIDRFRFGARFIVEGFVPGAPVEDCPDGPAARRAMARALARLHRVEATYSGYVGRPERRSFAELFARRIERRLRILKEFPRYFTPEEIAQLGRWFDDRIAELRAVRKFQLCHMHLSSGDMLYDAASDSAWLVDCGGMQFTRASRDLANLQPFTKSWIANEENHREFIEAYLEASPPERREEYEREGAFFEAYRNLSRLRLDARHATAERPMEFERGKHLAMRRQLLLACGLEP